MKIHRVLVIVLMIYCLASFMPACAGNDISGLDSLSSVMETAVNDGGIIQTLLPETNFNGFTMTIMRSSSFFTEKGVYSDELTADVVADAVYERNSRIEEGYNCAIELYEVADYHPYTHMHSLVLSADDTVDVVLDGGQFIASSIADYMDLYSLRYFNFDYPWWNSRFNHGISIGGKLYFTVGAYMISAKQNLYGVIFNKDIASNYNLDITALYEAAYNDSWTFDMMHEYAAALGSVDLNGDGKIEYNDLWAVYGEAYSGWTLSLGAGFRCAKKDDSDDLPYITFGDEANNDVINKMMNIIGDRNITLLAQQINDNDRWDIYGDQMSRGDCYLFYVGGLGIHSVHMNMITGFYRRQNIQKARNIIFMMQVWATHLPPLCRKRRRIRISYRLFWKRWLMTPTIMCCRLFMIIISTQNWLGMRIRWKC